MSRRLHVHLLPELTTEEALAESHVVVIDVLRASTTIVHALASGAAEVIPCLETDDARELSKRLASDNPLLGGERGGEPIDGFDMGNSPTEYVESKVRGRKIIFTTTNGTKAMQLCRRARRVLVGSVVNLSAIVRELREVPRIDLLCAGTHGEVSREDVLAAGWMTHLLLEHDAELALDDQALIAQATFRDANLTLPSASDDDRERCVDKICEALLDSHGGKNLIRLNRQGDVRIAADVDSHDLIPELDSGTGTIQAVSGRKSTSDGGD